MAAGRASTNGGRLIACFIATIISLLAFPAPAQADPPATCTNTTLVLDESGSVDPYETTVRSAVHAFLDGLVDSGVATSIVEFGSSATTVTGYTAINPPNMTSIFNPYVDATSLGNVYDSPSQLGAFTNWDDALNEVTQINAAGPVAPIVLFLTDGDPTAYNLDQSGEPGGVFTNGVTAEAVLRAQQEADQIRAQGSHLIAVGVGAALTSAASIDRLKQVAGPDVYNGSGTFDLAQTDVVLVPEFTDLPGAMSLIAQALCADPGISVEKTVSPATVTPGTAVTYEVTVTHTGNVPLHNVVLHDPLVTGCSQVIGTLAVGESTTVTCSVVVWAPLTNVATATGEDPFGTPVTDDGSAQVILVASGTGTPGFWKNHPEVWPILDGQVLIGDWNHNWTCDPDETCLPLTQEAALAALGTPPKGDMTWNLGRPLVAAWLNVSSGNDSSCIADVIDAATLWLIAHPLGSDVSGGDDAWREASGWAGTLDDYNNGRLCAEHRDSKETQTASSEQSSEPTQVQPAAAKTPPPSTNGQDHRNQSPGAKGNGSGADKNKP
jgi:uncharacterized repeat protein (TIGR01451 family)